MGANDSGRHPWNDGRHASTGRDSRSLSGTSSHNLELCTTVEQNFMGNKPDAISLVQRYFASQRTLLENEASRFQETNSQPSKSTYFSRFSAIVLL